MALTSKQEKFCQEVAKGKTYSDAYRVAYDCEKSSDTTINRKAYELIENGNITARIEKLREPALEEVTHTLSESIQQDKNLIERYENALDKLSCLTTPENELTAAERTIRYIGSSGYNGAKDRLNKINGYYEKDNKQIKPDTTPPIIQFTKSNEAK